MNEFARTGHSSRRFWLAVSTVLTSLVAAGIWWFASDHTTTEFAAASLFRVSIVLGCLWLAWPSLRRPAAWLPAGVAAACVVGLVVIAARPRLIVLVIPALGVMSLLATARKFLSGR